MYLKWKEGGEERRGGKGGGYHRVGRYLVILSRDEVALPEQVVRLWEAS